MSIESWRDGYRRGFLDGVEMRKQWDDENSQTNRRLNEVFSMRSEFDDVMFPDKCQECDGDCQVC